jgi:hypothetical protein
MPKFKLLENEVNRKLSELLSAEGCRVTHEQHCIIIEFNFGLNIFRVEAGSVLGGLTDLEWRAFINNIKSTLQGAKVRRADDMVISLAPVKSEIIRLRVNPQEKELIRKAAALKRKTLSAFIRSAVLEAVDETFAQESQEKESYVA